MPLEFPRAELQRMRAEIERSPEKMKLAIKRAGLAVLRDEFRTSSDPDGGAWKPRADGQPALRSRKLAGAFTAKFNKGDAGVAFVGRVPRDWLVAHDRGHLFGARKVDGRSTILRFNKRGRLVSAKRFEKLKRGRAVFAPAHTVGPRLLPARPIAPRRMSARWETAIKFAVLEAAATAIRRAGAR